LAGDKQSSPAKHLFNGNDLTGWKTVDFGGSGEPSVQKGVIVLPTGERLTGINYTGDVPKTNYEITLEARRVDGSDFFCGLTFPVGDSFASLIVGGWGGALCGISNLDGEDAAHNNTKSFQRFETGTWYKIKLRVTPDHLQAWIDDKQIVSADIKGVKISLRDEIEPSKPLGLTTFQTAAEFRNIQLISLSSAATAPSR
jgi:hypothetical protein